MLRRSLFLGVVAAASVVGLASSSAATANVTVERYHVDIPQIEVSPHCTNESISWTGGYDVVITTTTTDNGSTRSLNYVQKMEGVGLSTGNSYDLTSRYHETSRESDTGADVYHFGSTYVQRSRGGTPTTALRLQGRRSSLRTELSSVT